MSGPAADAIALSVVVPVHNGAATLGEQLEALLAQRWDRPWEIVVVDNASTDASARVADRFARRDGRIRVVVAPDQANLSYARNVGVAAARGRSVAFADDDDVVGEGWVAAMGAALDEHDLVGSRLEYRRLSDPASLVGRGPYQGDGVERVLGVPVVTGAGSGWSRALWDRLGGNDEAFYARVRAGEDTEMGIRAVRAGIRPVFVGDALYHYRRRAGFRRSFSQARRYGRSLAALEAAMAPGTADGARRASSGAAVSWVWLLARVVWLADPHRRTLWAWRAGQEVGRVQSAIADRSR